MALWKAGRGRKWVGWGALLEAQVIRRRNSLKSLSQVPFEPCSNPLQTFPKPPWSPLKPFWSPHQAALKPSSPWSPLQALLKAPETLLKPPSSPAWSPLHPLEAPSWSPSEIFLKPPWSPSSPLQAPFEAFTFKAPFKPFSKPPWSPLKVLLKPPCRSPLKPPWSSLEALLKPPWSPLQAPEGFTKVKPPSSPLEAPWEGLEAPLKPPFKPPFKPSEGEGYCSLVFGSFLDMCWAHSTRWWCPVLHFVSPFLWPRDGVIAGLRIARDMWEFIMPWFPHSGALLFLTSVAFSHISCIAAAVNIMFLVRFFSPYQSSHDAKPLSRNCADGPFSLLFLPEPVAFRRVYGTWDLLVYHVTIAAPYPGGIDPRLAVYARSWDGHYTTTRRGRPWWAFFTSLMFLAVSQRKVKARLMRHGWMFAVTGIALLRKNGHSLPPVDLPRLN